jgi:hypothetical protein
MMFARRLTTRAVLLVAAGAIALAGAGCSPHAKGKGGAGGDNGDSASIGGAPTASPTAPPAGNGAGSTATTNTGSDSGSGATASAPPKGPVVSYFRIKQKPQCPQGTNVNPIPGVDLIVEWSVSGADSVTLAVDGPGVYNTYGPKGSETFAFGCGGGTPGQLVSHTYTLVAEKDGKQAKKTLTASAKVYDIGQV